MSKLISAFVNRLSVQGMRLTTAKPASTRLSAKSMTMSPPPHSSKVGPHRPAPDYWLRNSHL
jgi:hypothetical protein